MRSRSPIPLFDPAVPLTWRTLFSGVVMTWTRALGEFGAIIDLR